MTRQHHPTPVARNASDQYFSKRLAQRFVAGSPGTPPEITLAYGESTNRITTSGYTYDLNGNLTAIPAINGAPAITSMAWDKFDRMTSITRGGVTSTYGYDAFGRRVRRSVGSSHRIFFYDISGRLLAEYDSFYGSAPPSRINRYFAGQRLGQYTDRLGSVRVGGGASSQYYPYGEEITSTSNDRHKFAELYRDSDTGLDYAMARYYAPSVGRFLSGDPTFRSMNPASPQSFNRYSYVRNNPANLTDPLGLDGMTCWLNPDGDVECAIQITHEEKQPSDPPAGGAMPPPSYGPIPGVDDYLGGGYQRPVPVPDPPQIDYAARDTEYTLGLADRALALPDCDGIFGSGGRKISAARVFDSIRPGGDQQLGSLTFAPHTSDWGDGKTFPVGRRSIYQAITSLGQRAWYNKVAIEINSTNWGGNRKQDLETIIHEIGHALYRLGRREGAFNNHHPKERDDPKNSELIWKNCIEPLFP